MYPILNGLRNLTLFAVATLLFTCVNGAPAASTDFLLEIESIPGESAEPGHVGQIELQSWKNTVPLGVAVGASARAPSVSEIVVTKQTDKATPQLMLACAMGSHIPTAILHVLTSGTRETFLKVTMSDCLVSSFSNGATQTGLVPTDQFSLNFTRIAFEYTFPVAGANPLFVSFSWDVKRKR
jgi:type VI secretion system secreted protein Hcp